MAKTNLKPGQIKTGIKILEKDGNKVCVTSAEGEIDEVTCPRFRQTLFRAIEEQPGDRHVIDLQGIDFLSSDALAVMVAALRKLRKHNRKGEISVASNTRVSRIFEITGLDKVFPRYPGLEINPG